jgi:hypothetical protein
VKKIVQSVAKYTFVKIAAFSKPWRKVAPKMWATCSIKKTAQSKQSPIGRKFGQSGHPAGVGTIPLRDFSKK